MADHEFTGTLSVTDKIRIGDRKEPNAQLDIFSSTAPSQIFLESGGVLLKLSVDASGAAIGTDNAFPLSIKTDDISRISVSQTGNVTISEALSVQKSLTVSGNVGIGTSDPKAKLEVNGTVKATAFVGDGSMLTGISKWSLAYAHDQNGNPIFGDINTLINAIQNGHRVRVLIDRSDYQYAFDAESLWIRNGIVYAQNTSSVSVTFEGDVLKFQDDSYHYMFIASTKGDYDAIRWSVGEHTPRGHNLDKEKMKWFIDKT